MASASTTMPAHRAGELIDIDRSGFTVDVRPEGRLHPRLFNAAGEGQAAAKRPRRAATAAALATVIRETVGTKTVGRETVGTKTVGRETVGKVPLLTPLGLPDQARRPLPRLKKTVAAQALPNRRAPATPAPSEVVSAMLALARRETVAAGPTTIPWRPTISSRPSDAPNTLGDDDEVPMTVSISRVSGPPDSLFAQIGGFLIRCGPPRSR